MVEVIIEMYSGFKPMPEEKMIITRKTSGDAYLVPVSIGNM
jgi:hypothetical protein